MKNIHIVINKRRVVFSLMFYIVLLSFAGYFCLKTGYDLFAWTYFFIDLLIGCVFLVYLIWGDKIED